MKGRMNAIVRHRHLPHWDIPGATYFVTSCLADSIPARGLLDIANYRYELECRERPKELTPDEWERLREKLTFARTDHWLDSDPAVRYLEDPQLARIVVASMFHFADERYELLAYVVMPSHFHWVFRPLDSWVESLGPTAARRTPRERIMHTLKTHTALECNRLLDRIGTFWQDESYDHCVRDEEELYRIIRYVEQNPVKAGLVTDADGWGFSSSPLWSRFGIQYGDAIKKECSM
jgi:type I restriction enzyme R subunit